MLKSNIYGDKNYKSKENTVSLHEKGIMMRTVAKDIRIWMCVAVVALTICCGHDAGKTAEEWLSDAREMYDAGDYDGAIEAIDSLRSQHPEAIDIRKQALRLYLDVELARAEREVMLSDSALQAAQAYYDRLRHETDSCRATGTATAEQLTATTKAGLRRDSIEAAFNFQCAKIKDIRSKKSDGNEK